MRQIKVSGPGEVAAALRTIAEGVEIGRIRIGEGSIACSSDVSALIEVPDGGAAGEAAERLFDETPGGVGTAEEVAAVTVRLHPRGSQVHRHLGIEQELTHPGG